MPGTVKTDAALLAEMPTGGPAGGIIPADLQDLIVSKLSVYPNVVSAAGTTQGTATVLTEMFNIVTTVAAGAGVMVTASYTKVWNGGANSLLVYPPSGAQFDAVGTNLPVSVGFGGAIEIIMTSSTQGYAR